MYVCILKNEIVPLRPFPKCTSETIKARPFLKQKVFLLVFETAYVAFIVSEVKFGNSSFQKNGH
jgi:hypothetical protein